MLQSTRRTMFSVITVTAIFAASLARAERAPIPPTAFDGMAPGARAIAMGGANCAVGGDPSSPYYNPAGIGRLSGNYFTTTYEATRQSELTTDEIFASETLKDRKLAYLGFVHPKGAFFWRPLANATVRTASGGDWQETQVKVSGYSLTVGHAHDEKLSSGLNLTYLTGQIARSAITAGQPSLGLSDGYGVTADLGFLYALSPEFNLGFQMQNLAGFMWWDGYDVLQLPFVFRAGIAFNVTNFLVFATDWEKRYYRGTDPRDLMHFGIEQSIGEVLKIRGGISGKDLNDKQTSRVSAGVGYQQNGYELSLAGEKYKIEQSDVYRYLISLNLPL